MPSAEYQRRRRARIKAGLPAVRKQRDRKTDEEKRSSSRKASQTWIKKHPDRYRDNYTRQNRNPLTKQRKKEYRLLKKYGLTQADWEDMFKKQGSCCAACQTNVPGSPLGWHVDHNHLTGKVRGILCHHCNTILGRVKDNPAPLYALAHYLETSYE